jgi:hypothetical protein
MFGWFQERRPVVESAEKARLLGRDGAGQIVRAQKCRLTEATERQSEP